MRPIPPPGPEGAVPATLRGAGWQPRTDAHRAELGVRWAPYAVDRAVAPLRAVLLGWPGPEQEAVDDPDAWLMLGRPDPARLQQQAEALAGAFRAQGVAVHWSRPPDDLTPPLPNHIFACDSFFMTPEGAILARMAARQRAGEERHVAAALAALGVPILLTPRGGATFEGADAMWLDPRTVLIGVGQRTNAAALDQLVPLLRSMGADVRVAELAGGVQHLLGAVDPIDDGLAAVRATQLTPSLRDALRGWELLELDDDDEVLHGRAMNFVALAPRHLLMPAGCPRARARYEARRVRVEEVDVSEYLLAAGGIGCATGVLARG